MNDETHTVSPDELRAKAAEIKTAAARKLHDNRIKLCVATALAVSAAICLSYYMGRRRASRP